MYNYNKDKYRVHYIINFADIYNEEVIRKYRRVTRTHEKHDKEMNTSICMKGLLEDIVLKIEEIMVKSSYMPRSAVKVSLCFNPEDNVVNCNDSKELDERLRYTYYRDLHPMLDSMIIQYLYSELSKLYTCYKNECYAIENICKLSEYRNRFERTFVVGDSIYFSHLIKRNVEWVRVSVTHPIDKVPINILSYPVRLGDITKLYSPYNVAKLYCILHGEDKVGLPNFSKEEYKNLIDTLTSKADLDGEALLDNDTVKHIIRKYVFANEPALKRNRAIKYATELVDKLFTTRSTVEDVSEASKVDWTPVLVAWKEYKNY